jgi:rod shape-determining protein MreC
MISAGRQEQQNIVRTLSLTIFSPAHISVGTFNKLNNVIKLNRELSEEIERVKLQNTFLREKLSEIVEDDMDYEEFLPHYEIVPADIVAREATFFYRTVIINVGANHGIKNSMPVISGGSVVGKVISVLPLTAQVQMIYEPEEYISIEHPNTGSVGILDSRANATLFANVRSVAPVEIGDTVYTTGLGGIYPKGLQIGVIEKIDHSKDSDIFKRIYIKSAVDFERLRKVFVIKSEPQWEAIKNEILHFSGYKEDE